MSRESLIADIKAMIGKETPVRCLGEVYARDIRRFAQAVGDFNRLYIDEEYAKKSRYKGIIAPPLFYISLVYDRGTQAIIQDDGAFLIPQERDKGICVMVGGIPIPQLPGTMMFAEREVSFPQPIRPGDIISVSGKLDDVYEKEGRKGTKLTFAVGTNTYTNHRGEVVVRERVTGVGKEG